MGQYTRAQLLLLGIMAEARERNERMVLQENTEFPLEAQLAQAGSLAHKVREKQNKVQKQVHEDQVVTLLKHHREAKEKLGLVISGCFADPAGITQGTSMRISVTPSTCVYYFFGLPTFIGLNI